ncbi:MAG: ABC transporter permease [Trueperaceae bacterium]|nr:ABC transporter permease [Trueperaceae bacterium]
MDVDLALVLTTLARALAFSTPLLWAALGEIVVERAGVVNLGVEGMMILGALAGFVVAQSSGDPWLGLVAAAAAGVAAAALHALLSVVLRANQYVSGLAITIFGLGLTGLIGRGWVGRPLGTPMEFVDLPLLASIPLLGPALFQGQYVLSWLGLVAAVVLWFVLHHTRLGLVVRSVGENPAAADAAGVRVLAVRFAAVTFGGAMAGVAGGFLSLAYRPSWGQGMTNGLGWIALALAIFALWDPLRAIFAALLFGALFTLSFSLQEFFAPQLLTMMPYLFTILALAVTAVRKGAGAFGAPEALGEPYARGRR